MIGICQGETEFSPSTVHISCRIEIRPTRFSEASVHANFRFVANHSFAALQSLEHSSRKYKFSSSWPASKHPQRRIGLESSCNPQLALVRTGQRLLP